MGWSVKIGRMFGIDIFMHWTFPLLLLFVGGSALMQGEPLAVALEGVGFVAAVFACVVLHEYGHALTARRYGVATRDITLLPIGGVARLERMPENPWHELWVALAGPAVNVVIAGGLLLTLFLMGNVGRALDVSLLGGAFLARLMVVNVVLVVFNLLPAFPMDGGRVLRAVLAMRMPYAKATRAAARTGQLMAVLFAVVGLIYNPFLLLIAVFIYFGAAQESQAAQLRSLLKGVAVHEAMLPKPGTLSPYDRTEDAADIIATGYQHDYPVLHEGRIVGLVVGDDLFNRLKQGEPLVGNVSDVMRRDPPTVEATSQLEDALVVLQENQLPALPVTYYGQLVGLLTVDSLNRFANRQAARVDRELELPSQAELADDLRAK